MFDFNKVIGVLPAEIYHSKNIFSTKTVFETLGRISSENYALVRPPLPDIDDE